MTLSRFLRDYLYIGLGGNGRGAARRYANLLITMLLGESWHGASWTFVLWGGLHGIYLMINHGWIAVSTRSSILSTFRRSRAGAAFGFVVTFIAVLAGWVLFRAPNMAAAGDMLGGMIGRHGAVIPAGLAFALEPFGGLVAALGISYAQPREPSSSRLTCGSRHCSASHFSRRRRRSCWPATTRCWKPSTG